MDHYYDSIKLSNKHALLHKIDTLGLIQRQVCFCPFYIVRLLGCSTFGNRKIWGMLKNQLDWNTKWKHIISGHYFNQANSWPILTFFIAECTSTSIPPISHTIWNSYYISMKERNFLKRVEGSLKLFKVWTRTYLYWNIIYSNVQRSDRFILRTEITEVDTVRSGRQNTLCPLPTSLIYII